MATSTMARGAVIGNIQENRTTSKAPFSRGRKVRNKNELLNVYVMIELHDRISGASLKNINNAKDCICVCVFSRKSLNKVGYTG